MQHQLDLLLACIRPPCLCALYMYIGLMMMWLTFDIQFYEGRFTHAQGILSNTLVCACSGSRHGANGDFFVGAKDSIDTFFLPPNLSWRVAFSHTPHGDRILFFFQVAQRSRLSDNIWWICEKEKNGNCWWCLLMPKKCCIIEYHTQKLLLVLVYIKIDAYLGIFANTTARKWHISV